MKNLLYLIDKLEDLPIDTLSLFRSRKDLDRYDYPRRGSDYHPVNGVWPRTGALRIIEKNIGKSFALAFSYFCKKFPKYQQKEFLEHFEDNRLDPDYIIDEEGNIQPHSRWAFTYKHKCRRHDLTFYSIDYKAVWQHKITKVQVETEPDGSPALYARCIHRGCDHNACSHTAADYELVVISGWKKTFDRWKDREFRKLRIQKYFDQQTAWRKKYKSPEISFSEILESTVDKREENRKWTERREESRLRIEKWSQEKARKEHEANLVKIISHGFDPVNSFRHKPIKKNETETN